MSISHSIGGGGEVNNNKLDQIKLETLHQQQLRVKNKYITKVQKYIAKKKARQKLNNRYKCRHIINNNKLNTKLVETASERSIENKLQIKLTQIQLQDKYTTIKYRNRKFDENEIDRNKKRICP